MAAKSFDYSKWDNIELSDDESDLHPNIDKESWFRMKHRSRLEREEREDVEMKEINKLNEQDNARIKVITARIQGIQSGRVEEDAEFEDAEALQGELKELQQNVKKRQDRVDAIMKKRAWNIDNICKVKEERSIVNTATSSSLRADDFQPTGLTEKLVAEKDKEKAAKSSPTKASPAPATTPTPAAVPAPQAVAPGPAPVVNNKKAIMSYNDYVLTHEATLEKYSEIRSLEDTQEFLLKHCDILLHEHSQNYMLLSCLEDEMNGKHKRMKLVCRQCQILTHIQELAVSMSRDPRDVIRPFFYRINEPEYLKNFLSAVEDFTEKIRKRAVEKKREMDLERAQDDDESNPALEVLKQLPEPMRKAFESQNIEKLHEAVAEMDAKEARKYMRMCVAVGLWVPKDEHEFDSDGEEEDEVREAEAVEEVA